MTPTSPIHPSVARRRAGAVALIAAAVCGLLQAFLQPVGSDGTSAQLVQSVLAHPAQATAATVFDLLNWVLAVPGIVALWGYLRGRGRVLGTIGVVLVALGATAVSIGSSAQQVVLEAARLDPAFAVRLNDATPAVPIFGVAILCIYLGLIGMVLATIGAVRGRLVPWWVLAIELVGLVANIVLDQNLYGLPAAALYVLPGVAQALIAVALLRSGSAVSPSTVEARTDRIAAERVPA